MKVEITNQYLFMFLTEHDAWEDFITECNNRDEPRSKSVLIQLKTPYKKVSEIIMGAFTWSDTEKGGLFWMKLHHKAELFEEELIGEDYEENY